jgi:hypothetical protein
MLRRQKMLEINKEVIIIETGKEGIIKNKYFDTYHNKHKFVVEVEGKDILTYTESELKEKV